MSRNRLQKPHKQLMTLTALFTNFWRFVIKRNFVNSVTIPLSVLDFDQEVMFKILAN